MGSAVVDAGRVQKTLFDKARADLPTTAWEYITAAIAAVYLQSNFSDNRTLRRPWVDSLAEIMLAGKFRTTHIGIAFDALERLVDGQHRLAAIIKAALTCPDFGIWLLVTRDLPAQAVEGIDSGVARTQTDTIRITTGEVIDSHDVALARMMLLGGWDITTKTNSRVPTWSMTDFLVKHREAITFARQYEVCLASAPIRAVVARAYYHADRDRLTQFLRILTTGVVDDPKTDTAAIALRTAIMMNPVLRAAGRDNRAMLYRKTLSVVCAFLARRGLTKVYAAEREVFPLPE